MATIRTQARGILSLVGGRSTLISLLVVTAIFAACGAEGAYAQATLTWASPGANSDISNSANWVGGVAPNFAGDATTDSAIFAATTNTTVQLRNVTTGDPFAIVTFDAAAPAYTFTLPSGNTTNELSILPAGNITNNSANTQTLTGIAALTLNGAASAPGTLFATAGNVGTNLSFDVGQIKFNNPGSVANTGAANTSVVDLSAGFNVRTSTILGVQNSGVSSSLYVLGNTTSGTGGTLFITGDSGTNTGRLVVGTGGVVRISHNNALGDGTLNIPATTGDSQTVLLGGGRNGRVELTGNITVNEGFVLIARQNNVAEFNAILAPAILNVSGNNTLTGTFAFGAGGNAYNFGSDAGTLTIQSNLAVPTSAQRYITFQRAGSINVTGNIIGGPAASGTSTNDGVGIVKYDSGTTTLSGTANDYIAGFSIRGGTLALSASSNITWAPFNSDTFLFLPPRVDVYAGATFDVSAKVGGYNLTQTLQGSGTVIGSVIMASGTQILPGATEVYDSQGMSWGDYSDVVGKLTFQSGGLNLAAGSSMVWQLGALSTSNPGTDFDQLVVGGNLALGGTSDLTLDFSLIPGIDPSSADPFWNTNRTWKIIDATSNTGNTNFAALTNATFGSKFFTTTVGIGADAGDIFLNWIAGATLHPGDFDSDGDVDGADFVAWQTNFPKPNGATLAQGDADGDGDVDGADFVVWQTNFPFSPGPGASPVPEPNAIVLCGLAGLGLVLRRRSLD